MRSMASGGTVDGVDRAQLEELWQQYQRVVDWLKDKFRAAIWDGSYE